MVSARPYRDELVVDNYKGTKVDTPFHAAKDWGQLLP